MADLESPMERIASLVEELERSPESPTRERARALVQAVLDLHRVGLVRILEMAAARPDGSDLVRELSTDQTVTLLMSLHDLQPESAETRVRAAVDGLRPLLLEQGVAIELEGTGEDAVRVRLRKAGTIRAADARLRAEIEGAIFRSAPEIATIEIDGLDGAPVVPLTRLIEPRK